MLNELKSKDELFDIALELEEVALTDDYFIEKKLYPNVDFYSGLIYRAMGFPTDMFPVLFAIGRLPGWIAHWWEGNENPEDEDRPAAPDLHRAGRAQVRADRPARLTRRFRSEPAPTGLSCATGVSTPTATRHQALSRRLSNNLLSPRALAKGPNDDARVLRFRSGRQR